MPKIYLLCWHNALYAFQSQYYAKNYICWHNRLRPKLHVATLGVRPVTLIDTTSWSKLNHIYSLFFAFNSKTIWNNLPQSFEKLKLIILIIL